MDSLSANSASIRPDRARTLASAEGESSGMWTTTHTAAASVSGSEPMIRRSGSSAPADPPITTTGA